MSLRLADVCFDGHDPAALGTFWSGPLGRAVRDDGAGGVVVVPPADGVGFGLRFLPTDGPVGGRHRMHLDLTSTSPADQEETVARALRLGAHHLDVGQRPEEGHVVLADPEGNELCVVGPGNAFLAGTGAVGALSCDGTREVGLFWSTALGWSLVWEHEQETAIQSPRGGPKISWGGPPVMPKNGRNRVHLHVSAAPASMDAEVDRLLSLGAARPSADGCGRGTPLLDPDGNELCVVTG